MIKSAEHKREVERGSPFTLTSDLSCIAYIYFTCEIRFYARTHIKITRHWKSTLTYLVSGHLGEGINKAKRQALSEENFQDIGSGEEVTTYVL